jgi:hypothetical protein
MDSSRFLELLGPIGFLSGVAALVIYGIQIRTYRQRLRAAGFEPSDLKSAASINKKWGELIRARLPERIEFKGIDSHSWSNKQKHRECERALDHHRFERIGLFVATPQEWIAEFWVSESLASGGVVIDSKLHGPYLDLMTWYEDGGHSSFANHPNTGLCEWDEQHVFCGYITPEELIARWLRERPKKEMKSTTRDNVVRANEQTTNDHLARHRREGVSAEQINSFFEFRRRYKK